MKKQIKKNPSYILLIIITMMVWTGSSSLQARPSPLSVLSESDADTLKNIQDPVSLTVGTLVAFRLNIRTDGTDYYLPPHGDAGEDVPKLQNPDGSYTFLDMNQNLDRQYREVTYRLNQEGIHLFSFYDRFLRKNINFTINVVPAEK